MAISGIIAPFGAVKGVQNYDIVLSHLGMHYAWHKHAG